MAVRTNSAFKEKEELRSASSSSSVVQMPYLVLVSDLLILLFFPFNVSSMQLIDKFVCADTTRPLIERTRYSYLLSAHGRAGPVDTLKVNFCH
jgi:hypothetical protein